MSTNSDCLKPIMEGVAESTSIPITDNFDPASFRKITRMSSDGVPCRLIVESLQASWNIRNKSLVSWSEGGSLDKNVAQLLLTLVDDKLTQHMKTVRTLRGASSEWLQATRARDVPYVSSGTKTVQSIFPPASLENNEQVESSRWLADEISTWANHWLYVQAYTKFCSSPESRADLVDASMWIDRDPVARMAVRAQFNGTDPFEKTEIPSEAVPSEKKPEPSGRRAVSSP